MLQTSAHFSAFLILPNWTPITPTKGVSSRLIVSFGDKHRLPIKRRVEVTNNTFALKSNFEDSLFVDFVTKVNLAFHEEQDLINLVQFIEEYLLRVDPSRFQILKDSQHELLEICFLPSVQMNSNVVHFEKMPLVLKEREEIPESLKKVRIQKVCDDGDLDIFGKLF